MLACWGPKPPGNWTISTLSSRVPQWWVEVPLLPQRLLDGEREPLLKRQGACGGVFLAFQGWGTLGWPTSIGVRSMALTCQWALGSKSPLPLASWGPLYASLLANTNGYWCLLGAMLSASHKSWHLQKSFIQCYFYLYFLDEDKETEVKIKYRQVGSNPSFVTFGG